MLTIRDADYAAYGVVIELDGQVFHDGSRHQDDLARDVLVALDDRVTLRLGWRQVIDDGCTTAAHVARLLAARGWQGAQALLAHLHAHPRRLITCPVA